VNPALADLNGLFAGRLLVDEADKAPFLVDWLKLKGDAIAVAMPETTEGVAAILRWAARTGTAIAPQGGNTGLAGGSVPQLARPTVLLSLKRLNRIRSVDAVNSTLVAEAGCLLADVQAAAAEAARLFPLSLAAEGSCTIGGNLACNAGGTAVLRYGTARELCLGLEVVTADGEIWNGLNALRKNNTGYSLRDLFIGSEGTLGVITAAVLKLFPKPRARATAMVGLDRVEQAALLLAALQSRSGGAITTFELMSARALALVLAHLRQTQSPVESACRWYLLIEVSDQQGEDAAAATLEEGLAAALESGQIKDAVIASSLSQAASFWRLRESMNEAQAATGKVVKHDVSLPISALDPFIAGVDAALSAQFPDARTIIYGHLGDGNLHLSALPPERDPHRLQPRDGALINRIVHDLVHEYGGAISAEHGIGTLRRDELPRYKSEIELKLMRRIKTALDPDWTLNPGVLLAPPDWPTDRSF